MNKYNSFALLFITIINIVTARESYTEGYFWRDYDGVIPADALPAGFDENGRPIYVGQVLAKDKLIPGKIYENDVNIYYEFGERAWSTSQNIKILCTQNPENFEWLPTTVHGVSKLHDKYLIKGGHEPGFLIYIGRVYENKRTNVGKVICGETACLALYANENGKEVEYHTFEILSYNPINENAIKQSYNK